MTATGWVGEGPDGGPAMPVTELLLAQHERGPGDTLETALARSRGADARQARDEAGAARDPDEVASSMVSRGYRPGLLSDLSIRLQETEALLAAEEDKLEKTAQRNERTRRMLERGQIGGQDLAARMGAETDEGDPGEVTRLSRRADSLRRQIGEAQAMISPQPEQAPDEFASANRTAHEFFAATTRQRMAEAQAGIRHSEPRPFAGGSVAARAETVNGSAVAVAERLGLGEDVQRDAHGERIQCAWSPLPDGGLEHVPHGGRCLTSGGNTYQRYGS